MAERVKIVKPDWAEIRLPEKGMQLTGESEKTVEIGRLNSHEVKEVRWKIKLLSKESTEIEVSINSTRGGVEKKKLQIK